MLWEQLNLEPGSTPEQIEAALQIKTKEGLDVIGRSLKKEGQISDFDKELAKKDKIKCIMGGDVKDKIEEQRKKRRIANMSEQAVKKKRARGQIAGMSVEAAKKTRVAGMSVEAVKEKRDR